MKLVAIGIGSVIFGIELLRDVFRVPEFRGAELWLVDTDAAALAPDDRAGRPAQRGRRLADGDPRDAGPPSRPCPGPTSS